MTFRYKFEELLVFYCSKNIYNLLQQTRDEGLSRKLQTMEQNNKELEEKNSRLQEDKYNLEQLVSQKYDFEIMIITPF